MSGEVSFVDSTGNAKKTEFSAVQPKIRHISNQPFFFFLLNDLNEQYYKKKGHLRYFT